MKRSCGIRRALVCALSLALAACLTVLLPASALAESHVRYPDRLDTVSDFANALSSETIADIGAFSKLAAEKIGVSVSVATVHFLDGEDIDTYLAALFDRWKLGDMALLVVAAVGEDEFGVLAGSQLQKKLPAASTDHLLSASGFSTAIRAHAYDDAANAFFPALAGVLEKQYGVKLSLTGLFGVGAAETVVPAATATPRPAAQRQTSRLWADLFDFDDFDEQAEVRRVETVREKRGMSFGGVLVLIVLLMLIFGRRGRGGRRPSGCGCSPLGYLLGGLGIAGWLSGRGGRARGGFNHRRGPR